MSYNDENRKYTSVRSVNVRTIVVPITTSEACYQYVTNGSLSCISNGRNICYKIWSALKMFAGNNASNSSFPSLFFFFRQSNGSENLFYSVRGGNRGDSFDRPIGGNHWNNWPRLKYRKSALHGSKSCIQSCHVIDLEGYTTVHRRVNHWYKVRIPLWCAEMQRERLKCIYSTRFSFFKLMNSERGIMLAKKQKWKESSVAINIRVEWMDITVESGYWQPRCFRH